jgi:hypothetical protein
MTLQCKNLQKVIVRYARAEQGECYIQQSAGCCWCKLGAAAAIAAPLVVAKVWQCSLS